MKKPVLRTYKKDILNKIHNLDSRLILNIIPKSIKVQTTITSPPYFDMKDYGAENQVGYGQNYDDYLDDLKNIFENVFKITKDDGTLWIIIDTLKRNNQVVTLPFDLANTLKKVGWIFQDIIIWKKDKTVPWSTNGFMQRKFEYILFFSKSATYKNNKDRVRLFDTTQLKKWWVKYPERYNPKGKALDEIWEFPIPVQGSWGDEYIRHFCPLPKEMVATMIQISTDENDVVLDPFAGSGTVLSQSAYMRRKYIGFELNSEYIEMFNAYLKKTFIDSRKEYELSEQNKDQNLFEEQILNLRALKFARVLLNHIEKETNKNDLKIYVSIIGKSIQKNKSILVENIIIGQIDEIEMSSLIKAIIAKRPLSKYGIEPKFEFVEKIMLDTKKYFGYSRTNSYSYIKDMDINSNKTKVISNIKVDLNEKDYN
jgi:DNA modification methylase